MPFVPVPNVAMLELRFLLAAQHVENTMYFRNETGWLSGELLNLANLGVDWWVDSMATWFSSELTLQEGFVTDLTTNVSGIASYSVGLPVAGGQSGECAGNAQAACISFHTAKRGRANRGRNYLCGFPANKVEFNTLDAGWLGAMVAAYTDLMGQAVTAGYEMVVVSRFLGTHLEDGKKVPTPRVTGLSEPIVSFSFTDNIVDSLRTRAPNH